MRLGGDQLESQVLLKASFALAAILTLSALSGCTSESTSAVSASPSIACPSADPLLGIYDPSRLTVLKPCQWFHGTVVETDTRSDGDLHILATADPGDTQMLNVENVNAGGMVIEIVPGQTLPAPTVGEHIAVFGTLVLDEHNGWNEIHPVWAIDYPDRGTTAEALPPASPIYNGGEKD